MPIIKGYIVDPEARSIHRYDVETGNADAAWEDNQFSRVGRLLGLHDPVYEMADGEWGEIAVIHDYTQHGTPVSIGRLTVRGKCMIVGEDCSCQHGLFFDAPLTLDEAKAMTTFWRPV